MSPFPTLSELNKRRAPGSAPLASSMLAIFYAGLALTCVLGASRMLTDEAQAMQGPPAAELGIEGANDVGEPDKTN
ncbi:MAG: hypothetical protein ACJAZ8_000235 [Planctomycetota bacterium]|jgi:hypothetical protein